MTKTEIEKVDIRISLKAGRCTDGFERGKGQVFHAVPYGREYGKENALCGTEPGKRSVGWSTVEGKEITCKNCLIKYNKLK